MSAVFIMNGKGVLCSLLICMILHGTGSNAFNINIVAGSSRASSTVAVTGTDEHVITDSERTTFRLGDHSLKTDVEAYFGKRPDDAFLRSPTPWGDLYKTYNWPQVKVVVVPVSYRVLSVSETPVIVKQQQFVNNSPKSGKFNVEISERVTNSVARTWTKGGSVSIGQKFTYKVEFLGTGGGGETSMTFEGSWSKGGTNTKTTTVGSRAGVMVDLNPGERIKVILNASRGKLRVAVRYRAKLTGSTAVNYGGKFKGHHFWALPINKVLGNKPGKTRYYTENIEIAYYSKSRIELKRFR